MHRYTSSLIFVFPIILSLFNSCDCNKPKTENKDIPGSTAVEEPKRNVVVPAFDADSAYDFISKQVAFGPRIPGTPAQSKCAAWLTEKLKSYTPDVVVQDLKVGLYNRNQVPCKNIVASFNPKASKRILLCAHWDTRPWSDRDSSNPKLPFDGADDGGSGVAVLLEIASLLSKQPPAVGVDIAFFDVEDYGPPSWDSQSKNEEINGYCLGTQEWANTPHVANYRAYYGILLDMVGAKNATFLQEGLSLQNAPTIVQKVWDTAASLGYGNYFLYTRVNPIVDDHSFVNSINQTPCIDIINLDKTSPTGFARHWHTQRDNMNIIDKQTLKAVGQTLLQVVYAESPQV